MAVFYRKADLLNLVLTEIFKTRVVVIGEIHGVKENALFLKQLIEKIGFGNIGFIAFEYPNSLQPFFDTFPLPEKTFLSRPEIKILSSDGRFSKAHLDLIKGLIKENVKILALDPSSPTWNERDKKMYKILLHAVRLIPKNKVVLVVVGNLHSLRKPFNHDGKKFIPFASYLNKLVNIKLIYDSGAYYNHGLKIFPKTDYSGKRVVKIKPNQFEVHIQKATPTKKEP